MESERKNEERELDVGNKKGIPVSFIWSGSEDYIQMRKEKDRLSRSFKELLGPSQPIY